MENKNTWCVYMHTSPSGKVYIGITSGNPKDRWKNGFGYLKKNKNGDYTQPSMARAINKYGWDSFQHNILFENLSKQEAEHKERLFVAFWETNNPKFGYNIRGGGGSCGTMSEESRKKISESRMGEKNPNFGKPLSLEARQHLSEIRTGEGNPFYGKHLSDEHKQKISEANKGRKHTKETCKKISKANKGRKLSEETKNKISESLKGENAPNYGKHLSEETKRKLREINIGRKHTDATKKRLSDMRKGITPPEKCLQNAIKANKKSILCIELNKQWDSVISAAEELNIDPSGIAKVARGVKKSAGKHPITGEKLHWKYVGENI